MADGAHTRQMTRQEMVQQLDEMRFLYEKLNYEWKQHCLQEIIASLESSWNSQIHIQEFNSSPSNTITVYPEPSKETMKNIEPETMKKYDPFIEPLKDGLALQVLDSVLDVLMVHKVDSHVKEVEESSQQSTNGNDKIAAHQVFDQMPNACQKDLTVIESSNKEVLSFSDKDARVWEPGGLLTKMDHWDCLRIDGTLLREWFRRCDEYFDLHKTPPEMRVRVASPHMIASHVRQFDVTTVADVVWIAKHCESSLLQHSFATQNRAPFSPYQNYNDQPYYEREFGKCPEIEFDRESDEIKDEKLQDKQPEEDVKTLVMGSLLNVLVMSLLMMRNQVSLSSMEPSPRYLKESLVVVSDMSYDLGCVTSKTNGCICDSELGQANSHDEKEFKGLNLGKLLRDEWLLSIVCLLGLHDMSCWTQLLRQQIFPKSWRFKFKISSMKARPKVSQDDGFMESFNNLVCSSWIDEQFERRWSKMIGRFEHNENDSIHSLVSDFKTWVPHFGYELRLAGTDHVLGLVWSSSESDMTRLWRGLEVVLWFNSEKMDLDWFFQRDLHKLCLDIRRMIILLCLSADYRKLKVWVDTNYCEIRPYKTHVKLQEMSCFVSEKSLAKFVGYKAHGKELLVVGVKQLTLAATKFHLKHKWRSKFGSNKLTRTWTSYSRYDSSSCALRQEENYVMVLFIIIEALTLFNDQHTLVAEKNGTETSIVLKLIFGTSQDYYLLLFLERVKATFEIMLTVEHFENPLITILSYEWFHSPRPPELSCCKEDEESTAIGSVSTIIGLGDNEARA